MPHVLGDPAEWTVPGAVDLSSVVSVSSLGVPGGVAVLDSLGDIPETALGNVNFGAMLRGETGIEYRLCAAPIRNNGPSSYWQAINDTAHQPSLIGTMSTSSTQITINYGVAGLQVVSSIVTPDESLVAAGYTAGASVGTGLSNLTMARFGSIGDYVSYNGSTFVPELGASSPFSFVSFSSGVLTLTHADVGDLASRNVVLSGRGGGYVPMIAAGSTPISQTQVQIEFYDFAGSKVSTADTNMKVYVSRGCRGKVNPQSVTTSLVPGSNLWFVAIVEV